MTSFTINRLRSTYVIGIWFLALVVTACGCGSGDEKQVVIGKVAGRVTLDAKPLQAGCVLHFVPVSAGTEMGSGLIRDDGTYVATSGEHPGIPIGEYRVIVLQPPMDPKKQEELARKNLATAMVILQTQDKKAISKMELPPDSIVPRKYWAESTSGLKYTVKEGENTANFELSSDKAK